MDWLEFSKLVLLGKTWSSLSAKHCMERDTASHSMVVDSKDMKTLHSTRRQFLQSATAATVVASASAGRASVAKEALFQCTDIMRGPDSVSGLYNDTSFHPMRFEGGAWTAPGCKLRTEVSQAHGGPVLPIKLEVSAIGIVRLRVRWQGANTEDALCLGDHWERAYGDLEWRGMQPERVMPWYYMVRSGSALSGHGVQTGSAAFCFWQRDASGVTLSIDLHNGGSTADLRGRDFTLCTVVQRHFSAEVPFQIAMQAFCVSMCATPRLPATPLFGVNDWNYAYGKNTAAGILRDADLLASLAPASPARPHVVIDDGWQDPKRFASMPELAAQIRKRDLHPGLWIRPLRASAQERIQLLLPALRFGKESKDAAPAYDPTCPEAMVQVLRTISDPVKWGYSFLKHDFSTWEMFGRWGYQMGDQITPPGWNFADRKLTNAEVVSSLYRQIHDAAGGGTIILGCNTVGHLAAGIFESQRVGDDTSGKDWERTRRMGVNALAQRLAQHKMFFHLDPDIVAITREVDWRETRAWMDIVARTGTSLFFAPDPAAMTPDAKAAMKEAMALVIQERGAYPVQPTQSTTPEVWRVAHSKEQDRRYDWTPEGSSSSTTV